MHEQYFNIYCPEGRVVGGLAGLLTAINTLRVLGKDYIIRRGNIEVSVEKQASLASVRENAPRYNDVLSLGQLVSDDDADKLC